LQRALVAITAVATLGEPAAASFHIARRDVVEHQRAVGEMALGQDGRDGGLALVEPVERGIEFVVIDLAEAERFAEARGSRGECACGGQLGHPVKDAAGEQREDEIAAAFSVGLIVSGRRKLRLEGRKFGHVF
jgi:hypothetical protein